jgi:hypothetical protein
MADELDPALTGAALDLANAGYAAMPDREGNARMRRMRSATTAFRREAAEQRSHRKKGFVA